MAARQHERSSSGRDARAALATAGGQNRPTGAGLHTVPEAVLAGTAAVVRLEGALAHVNNSVGGGPGGPWVSLQTADYRGSSRPTASGAPPAEPDARKDATGLINFTWVHGTGQTSRTCHHARRMRSHLDHPAHASYEQNQPIQRTLGPACGSDTPTKQNMSALAVAAGVTRLLRSGLLVTALPPPEDRCPQLCTLLWITFGVPWSAVAR